jgi:hypothetical protein
MSSAEAPRSVEPDRGGSAVPPGQPDRGGSAVPPGAVDAVARVLGIDASGLRADTPLAPLGWDSLAGMCWIDAMSEAGWSCDPIAVSRAACVGDLADCAEREGASA